MDIKIGSAPDSWGVWFSSDARQTPWNRFLDEVAEAGYTWTELGPLGYMPTDVPTLRQELAKRGLKTTGTFIMRHLEDADVWPAIETEVLALGDILTALEGKFLVIIDDTYSDLFTGAPTRPNRLDDDQWKRLIENTHKTARLAKEKFGLQGVYHPHAETHVEYEDQIERFLQDTDPAIVSLCLDTGHHAYRGGDPVRFMRKHHERIHYLHLKSIDAGIQKRVESERIPFALAVGMDMFCEPAEGAVDFLAFRNALQDLNYDGWATVEQDMYPAPFDKPLPIAKRTREYLREIGLG